MSASLGINEAIPAPFQKTIVALCERIVIMKAQERSRVALWR